MNPVEEKAAIDAFVRALVDHLEPEGEPVADVTVWAARLGIFPTSVEAYAALEVLERLGLIRTAFGVVVPGEHFADVKSRRTAARPPLS